MYDGVGRRIPTPVSTDALHLLHDRRRRGRDDDDAARARRHGDRVVAGREQEGCCSPGDVAFSCVVDVNVSVIPSPVAE
jgi:hypothetical protein